MQTGLFDPVISLGVGGHTVSPTEALRKSSDCWRGA